MPQPTASVVTVLRMTFIVVPIVAGLDKFFGLLADWEAYLAPGIESLLPIGAAPFLYLVGIIEITVGALTATRFVRIAAYVASAWLTLIALQLLLLGKADIAVRDLVMAVAAWSLARLSPGWEVAGERGGATEASRA